MKKPQAPSHLSIILSETTASTTLHNFLLKNDNMDDTSTIIAGGRRFKIGIASLNSAPSTRAPGTEPAKKS